MSPRTKAITQNFETLTLAEEMSHSEKNLYAHNVWAVASVRQEGQMPPPPPKFWTGIKLIKEQILLQCSD